MPINVYTGLMRSGKSYEVVSEVVVPAVRSGRRVVTNIDGISEEKIHQYLVEKHPNDDAALYGSIVHVDNSQVFSPDFFPHYDDLKGAHTDTLVQPGDLVCVDEAWRFWGATDCKLHKNHKSFFLEHGHFTSATTNVACDLVLMIQDMSNLHRFVKAVVAFNFRTHKKVALGMGNTYSLTMWEGYKQSRTAQVGNWIRKYQKDVFPLYSSFKGGAQGVMVNADKRMNIFTDKKLWLYAAMLIIGGVLAFYNVLKFFNPPSTKANKPDVVAKEVSRTAGYFSPHPIAPLAVAPVFSEMWKLTGTIYSQGKAWVVLTNPSGTIRLESPSMFINSGMLQSGDIDGAKVTSWSGFPAPKSSSSFGAALSTSQVNGLGHGPTVGNIK
ncbi:zona occludens toxin [Janthinobacterium sp. CG_23.3]|uniref:zonular occludens toxin domain-containing protein n=1 Tax=Janthinobacterium sp. CG_23.3 TaxID=3349634 RepID=UPI0038D4982C